MSEGYRPDEEDAAFSGLDEYLCEYVDGTMDPAVRSAFEEYLRANPDLLAHVACLCRTRQLLCRYGCMHAPSGFQRRLRRRLAGEMLQSQFPALPALTARLGTFATWTSFLIVMMMVGMGAGVVMQAEAPYAARPAVATQAVLPHPATPYAITSTGYAVPSGYTVTSAGYAVGPPEAAVLMPATFLRPDTVAGPLQRLRATP